MGNPERPGFGYATYDADLVVACAPVWRAIIVTGTK